MTNESQASLENYNFPSSSQGEAQYNLSASSSQGDIRKANVLRRSAFESIQTKTIEVQRTGN